MLGSAANAPVVESTLRAEVRLGAEPGTASEDRAKDPTFRGSPADSAASLEGPPAAPVARTVYLQVPPSPTSQGSLTARLAIVYLASFAFTTILVLGAWTNARSQRRPAPPPAPEVRIVEKVVEVPVPVPVQVEAAPEPATPEVAPAEAAPPAPAPAPEAAPRPAPRPRAAPRPAPEPVVEAVPEPAPVVAPAPAPPPPPAPVVPPAAKALDGTYTGKGSGDPLSITFTFGPEGKLSGRIARNGGPSLAAAGTYQLQGDKVSFVLLEASGTQRVTFTGTLGASGASGRMALKSEDLGKFSVAR